MFWNLTDHHGLTAEAICRWSEGAIALFARAVTAAEAAWLAADWRFWRRANQAEPKGDWQSWLVMAGRGFGKTRMGAEWIRVQAEADGSLRIALVGATAAEVRAVMVEGESGVIGIAPADRRPRYEPSIGRITWGSGAQAFVYSAAEPDALRGAQHDIAWCDEIAKWREGEAAWDNLAMGMRRGDNPRVLATTTPRPVPLVRRLIARIGAGVALTRGRTRDNAANLPPRFLDAMAESYAGSRLGRQELDGELIDDAEGTLWPRALIDGARVRDVPGPVGRVVIGVDPPAGRADGGAGDACGIVVVALAADDAAYVLADCSVTGASPERWARAVADAAQAYGADRVVAERNMGGEMVASVLRAADVMMPLRLVTATRGKSARAEPVAALYEAGRAFHAGAFPALEDELAGLVAGGGYVGPGRSPDRADALVWAMTELMLGRRGEVRVRRL